MKRLSLRIWRWMVSWLTREGEPHEIPLSDFPRLSQELKPGDVLLVEGRTRIASVIKLITHSPWTHSALYVGRMEQIRDPHLRGLALRRGPIDPGEQLLVEALLGQGTLVSPLSNYREEHLRVCRPQGLCPEDAERVVAHTLRRLGSDYDVRQLFDLARFFLPWGVLPRRWRSSLFEGGAGDTTRSICSALIAEAFASVDYPILPFVERRKDGSLRFFRRNPRLFTPRDFDYSPYFHILKYPFLGLDHPGLYRRLAWSTPTVFYSDAGRSFRASVRLARASEESPAVALAPEPAAPVDRTGSSIGALRPEKTRFGAAVRSLAPRLPRPTGTRRQRPNGASESLPMAASLPAPTQEVG
jgi:hypothetical protein